tara:strand:- start:2707 stop:4203 length:1497 start_codon:yes stop_codon:yes gene_type:complete
MQTSLSEALNLFKEGDIPKAKKICEKILLKNKNNAEVYNLYAFTLYFTSKFEGAVDSWKEALNINPNYIEAFNGIGNAYLKLKNINLAIENFEKAIRINPNFFEAYCNLGSSFLKLKKYQSAIINFEKAIKIKPNYSKAIYGKAYSLMQNKNFDEAIIFFNKFIKLNSPSAEAYNAVASCLMSLDKFEESLDYLSKASNLDSRHQETNENLINLTKFYEPEKDYSNLILKINKKIRLNKFELNLQDQIKDEKIISYFNKIHEILKKNLPVSNFKEEQIFRRNKLSLNCDRHFKVFNTYNVIPEYCFGCYKIQIDLTNVLDLFKLHFIFDKLSLEGNNIRKTMIETRPNIKGTYKGLIYCSGLEEAKKIYKIVYPIIKFNINEKIKLFIKRGCTEFSLSYPNFDKIDHSVKYNDDWREKEKQIDQNYNFDEGVIFKNSISGLTISDALIMKNWLIYAKKIDDENFMKFSVDIFNNDYLEKKLSSQIVFRKKEFLKIKQL